MFIYNVIPFIFIYSEMAKIAVQKDQTNAYKHIFILPIWSYILIVEDKVIHYKRY